jgi:hypothetical protein
MKTNFVKNQLSVEDLSKHKMDSERAIIEGDSS